ncbi:hypothetical protein [Flagellimonas sp. S3867]|uniref:hypothetical protein n=1 Tax=Flagellimonas sp. S3867 TaxID=2768063 RepID=UPI0016868D67|nr:hypothetical protein [Flagellimonas sp. S3867]
MSKIIGQYQWFFSILILTSSCSPIQYCKKTKNYIKKVDTTKPFNIDGQYCISSIAKIDKDLAEVKLNIYDRISGKPLEGVIFFTDSISLKSEFNSGQITKELPPGNYQIEIASTGPNSIYSLPFKTKKIKLEKFSSTEINCYIGGILQH